VANKTLNDKVVATTRSAHAKGAAQPLAALPKPQGDFFSRPAGQRIYAHDYLTLNLPSVEAQYGQDLACYAERALLLAQLDDVVVLPMPVDQDYLAYLRTLGVGPREENVICISAEGAQTPQPSLDGYIGEFLDGGDMRRIASRIDTTREVWLSPFRASAVAHDLATQLSEATGHEVGSDTGSVACTLSAEHKDVVRTLVQALGVAVAQGECVDLAKQTTQCVVDAVARQAKHSRKAIIRGTVSATGADNLVVTAGAAGGLTSWLAQRPHLSKYLVESFVDVVAAPNVQLHIHANGQVALVSVSEQRIKDGVAHVGNTYFPDMPVHEDIPRFCEMIGRALHQQGYKGLLGIDFIETRQGELLFVEVNPRVNGATYPLGLVANLNAYRAQADLGQLRCWATDKARRVKPTMFSALAKRLAPLMYTHERGRGILPYMTGLLARGRLAYVAIGGSVEVVESLEAQLDTLLYEC